MLEAPSAEPLAIGARVKALREGMDLSLRELADRCGVGAATLSQVERGESSPTLVVAARIADGLELTLSQLLRLDEGGNVAVVRSGRGRRSSRPGHEIEELTPPLPGQRADVSRHRIEPGRATGGADDPPIHEPGSRETIVILAGSVDLTVDGERYPLAAGDSATFDADLPHDLHNPGTGTAEVLAVIAAGLRRS
ncbi:MAG: XRE family transcriptional regulator [Acidobacteria bacterium]|nr:MAG: XRE family transcriptional regulator [Acidobacteriota bacterium]MCL4287986.1 XRE family transcriptional regulator [Thermoleophilia bacterium]GIK78150.1 MAG: XRE family transcriptional regulator [Actinomycetes bacterium]